MNNIQLIRVHYLYLSLVKKIYNISYDTCCKKKKKPIYGGLWLSFLDCISVSFLG